MTDVIDLNFVTDGTLERIVARRDRYLDIQHENFVRSLDRLEDDAEKMIADCRSFMRAGGKPFDDLEGAETFARGLLLAILLLQRECA